MATIHFCVALFTGVLMCDMTLALVSYPAIILPSTSECIRSDPLQDERLQRHIQQAVQHSLLCSRPRTSCDHILRCSPSSPSGYYRIKLSNGTTVSVYCNMGGTGCGEGGWTRVSHMNMTDPATQCPGGFRVEQVSPGKRFRVQAYETAGCIGTTLDTLGILYTKVCGRALGYQRASPDGFRMRTHDPMSTCGQQLSSNYVDGLAITYDNPPHHLWTYAADQNAGGASLCPCSTGLSTYKKEEPPLCVGNNYYCESAVYNHTWNVDDPLWDGKDCEEHEQQCCSQAQLPWFHRTIPSTNAFIDMKLCQDQHTANESIGISLFELYIM